MAVNGLCLAQLLDRFIIENPPPRLSAEFFTRDDPLVISRELLGYLIWGHQPLILESSLDTQDSIGTSVVTIGTCVPTLEVHSRKRATRSRTRSSQVHRVKEEEVQEEVEVQRWDGTVGQVNKKEERQVTKQRLACATGDSSSCSSFECQSDSNQLKKGNANDSQLKKGVTVVCRISEVESYIAPDDRASHAYNYKRTPRNEAMYRGGGTAYVYRCYGVHLMLNIVTNVQDVPHAILVRAGMPVAGIQYMQQRRKSPKGHVLNNGTWTEQFNAYDDVHADGRVLKPIHALGRGPGCLTQCLGITGEDNGADLVNGTRLWITKGPDIQAFVEYACMNIVSMMRSNKGEANGTTVAMDDVKTMETETTTTTGIPTITTGMYTVDYGDVKLSIMKALKDKLRLFDQETTRLMVRTSPRIGVDYAGEDAKKLYRFFIDGDASVTRVSGTKKQVAAQKTTRIRAKMDRKRLVMKKGETT